MRSRHQKRIPDGLISISYDPYTYRRQLRPSFNVFENITTFIFLRKTNPKTNGAKEHTSAFIDMTTAREPKSRPDREDGAIQRRSYIETEAPQERRKRARGPSTRTRRLNIALTISLDTIEQYDILGAKTYFLDKIAPKKQQKS